MQLFLEVDNSINAWNSNPRRTSEMGHNFMSDWTTEEKKKLNGLTFPDHSILLMKFFLSQPYCNQTNHLLHLDHLVIQLVQLGIKKQVLVLVKQDMFLPQTH